MKISKLFKTNTKLTNIYTLLHLLCSDIIQSGFTHSFVFERVSFSAGVNYHTFCICPFHVTKYAANLCFCILRNENPFTGWYMICPKVTQVLVPIPATKQVYCFCVWIHTHLVTPSHSWLHLWVSRLNGTPYWTVFLLSNILTEETTWQNKAVYLYLTLWWQWKHFRINNKKFLKQLNNYDLVNEAN